MDIAKLFEIAGKLDLPELVARGVSFVAEVKANAARAQHVLTDADRAELDAIHVGALAAADRLDADLRSAETK